MTDKDIADKVYIEPLTVEVRRAADLKGTAGQCTAHSGWTGRAESGDGAGGAWIFKGARRAPDRYDC